MKTQIGKFQSQLEKEFQEDKEFYKDFFDEDLVKGVEDFDEYLEKVELNNELIYANKFIKKLIQNCDK